MFCLLLLLLVSRAKLMTTIAAWDELSFIINCSYRARPAACEVRVFSFLPTLLSIQCVGGGRNSTNINNFVSITSCASRVCCAKRREEKKPWASQVWCESFAQVISQSVGRPVRWPASQQVKGCSLAVDDATSETVNTQPDEEWRERTQLSLLPEPWMEVSYENQPARR